MPISPEYEYIKEHFIFHDLARRPRFDAVIGTYLAVQSALHFRRKEVDVGSYFSGVLPDLRALEPSGYCPSLGAEGLAYFHWLFTVELVERGDTDYHSYRFTRKRDGASVIARLKTSLEPTGPAFEERYQAQLAKLTIRHDRLLAAGQWGSLADRIGLQ